MTYLFQTFVKFNYLKPQLNRNVRRFTSKSHIIPHYKLTRTNNVSLNNVLQRSKSSNVKFQKASTKDHSIYLLDEQENDKHEAYTSAVNKFAERSFTCGELRKEHLGLQVTLCGWLEFQRMGKFLILRDGYGQTQFIIDKNEEIVKKLSNISYESILKIKGTVLARPTAQINKKQETGEIEVLIETLEVLNEARTDLPFNIREFQKAKEALRMQYRYLDMRFPEMQRNLRVRSELCMKMREFLVNSCGFVDVETPTLFKATPGGAQEFVVPTKFPGQFYSLVQSPQQFKQMLMAGGIDRYFQIARCYRDETSRPDRQPEFTQLDIEMSYVTREGIMALTEEMLQYCWPKFLQPLPKHFPVMSFNESLQDYGTDKPDIRYDYKINNCTDILKLNPKFCGNDNFYAGFLIFEEPYINFSKSIKEKLSLNQFPNTQAVLKKIKTLQDFVDSTQKLLGEQVAHKLFQDGKFNEKSLVFLVFGDKTNTLKRLGKLREDYVDHLENNGHKIRKDGMHAVWVLDFPLFEEDGPGKLATVHHPFTAPHPKDLDLIKTAPLQVRAQSYDLVLNGNEIAGGSIRIHNPKLQKEILNLLEIKTDELQHMLEMLSSGCPPHGGIAVGLDRLLSIILNTKSIRDVIAFPKTFEGRDPLSGAPGSISEEDKKLYHIKSIS